MISGVVVDGQEQVVPGVYFDEPDVANAGAPGNIAAGIPALVGTGVWAAPKTVLEFNSLDQVRAAFRSSGDIVTAAEVLYDALRDNRIPGRPSLIQVVSASPSAKASGVINTLSGPGATLEAAGYGEVGNRASRFIEAGSNKGVAITLRLDDELVTGDDIGGDPLFSLLYSTSSPAATMLATLDSTGLFASQTFTNAGRDDQIVTGFTSGSAARVVSTSTYDSYQVVTVYGLNGTTPVSEQLTLNGTTAVVGTVTMTKVTGARVDGLVRGTVTVTDTDGTPSVVGTFASSLSNTPLAGIITLVSANAGDVGMSVNVRGRSAIGTPLTETVVLNGTTPVSTAGSFTKLSAVVITGTTAGTVTVSDSTPQTLCTIAAGTNSQKGLLVQLGIRFPTDLAFNGALTLVSSGASTKEVIVRGVNTAGATVAERVVLTGTTPVTTSNGWQSISQIELGLVEAAQTLTFSGRSFTALISGGFDDMTVLEEFVNGKPGFTFALLDPAGANRALSDADYATSINIRGSAAVGFMADLATQIAWINANASNIALATRIANGTGSFLPDLTPQYLTGGSDGTATAADFEEALVALRAGRPNYVAVLSDDAAVHAFAEAHALFMAGPTGGAPCLVFVGLPTGTTKAVAKTSVAAFSSSRYMGFSVQEIQRRAALGGLSWLGPKFAAALEMGAMASARPGRSVTHKLANIQGVRQHSSFSFPTDRAECIRAGLSLLEKHPKGTGYRWVRSITTYTRAAVPAFQEKSASDALNRSLIDLVDRLEEALVGESNADTTPGGIKRLAESFLEFQKGEKLIKDYKNVVVVAVGTAVYVEFNVAVALPRLFVVLRTHLFDVTEIAA